MTPDTIIGIGKETIGVVLMVSGPVLLCGMAVGLIISVFQAVTQIQEMTLTFVPKIIAVFVALLALLPWIIEIMVSYTSRMITSIPNYVG